MRELEREKKEVEDKMSRVHEAWGRTWLPVIWQREQVLGPTGFLYSPWLSTNLSSKFYWIFTLGVLAARSSTSKL